MSETQPTQEGLEGKVAHLESQVEGLKRVGLLALILVFILGGLLVHLSYAEMGGVATQGVMFQDSSREFAGAFTVADSGHVAFLPVGPLHTLPIANSYKNLDLKGLGMYDSQGRLRILIGVDGQDRPLLGILAEDGKVLWSALALDPKGSARPGLGATPTP